VEAGAAGVGVVAPPEGAAVPEAPVLEAGAPTLTEAERWEMSEVAPVVTLGAPPVAEVPPAVGARPAEE